MYKIQLEFENLILMGFEPMTSRPMEALALRAYQILSNIFLKKNL